VANFPSVDGRLEVVLFDQDRETIVQRRGRRRPPFHHWVSNRTGSSSCRLRGFGNVATRRGIRRTKILAGLGRILEVQKVRGTPNENSRGRLHRHRCGAAEGPGAFAKVSSLYVRRAAVFQRKGDLRSSFEGL
jgi:hypothetical protein